MVKWSAGLLVFRQRASTEFLIVHPGGPFWRSKQEGAWSIPKGEFDPVTENGEAAAAREFEEELGLAPPDPPWHSLGETRLKSGKRIVAWGVEGDVDESAIVSNTFELEWPPRSGRVIEVPEIDEARWVCAADSRRLLNPAQVCFVQRIIDQSGSGEK